MGTTVSCRLIHIWWATEYLWQQDGVCGIDKKEKTTVPIFMAVKEHVTRVFNSYSNNRGIWQ